MLRKNICSIIVKRGVFLWSMNLFDIVMYLIAAFSGIPPTQLLSYPEMSAALHPFYSLLFLRGESHSALNQLQLWNPRFTEDTSLSQQSKTLKFESVVGLTHGLKVIGFSIYQVYKCVDCFFWLEVRMWNLQSDGSLMAERAQCLWDKEHFSSCVQKVLTKAGTLTKEVPQIYSFFLFSAVDFLFMIYSKLVIDKLGSNYWPFKSILPRRGYIKVMYCYGLLLPCCVIVWEWCVLFCFHSYNTRGWK